MYRAASGVQLVVEQDRLLTDRQRWRLAERARRRRRYLRDRASGPRAVVLDRGGETARRRVHERKVLTTGPPESLAQHHDHLQRRERVAAQREEVVVDADRLQLEHLLPDRHEHRFERRIRRHVEGRARAVHALGWGQCLGVQLAVGGHGQLADRDEGRRDGMPGQHVPQERPKLGRRRRDVLPGASSSHAVRICRGAGRYPTVVSIASTAPGSNRSSSSAIASWRRLCPSRTSHA